MEIQKITIDPAALEKNNMTAGEFLITIASLWGIDLDETAHGMVTYGTARVELGQVIPNQIAVDRAMQVIEDSTDIDIDDSTLTRLAQGMIDLYPKGKKADGTWWTDGILLTKRRLRGFFVKYGMFPVEDILDATERYVSEMTGNMYMRTLRNFIYVEDTTGRNSDRYFSDLYNWIVHKDEDDGTHGDWAIRIV